MLHQTNKSNRIRANCSSNTAKILKARSNSIKVSYTVESTEGVTNEYTIN